VSPTGPLVSVLTPVYNGEEYLEECIRSVVRQTYPNWEYIIVDNKSTDTTALIAERYAAQDARVRVLRATKFLDLYGNHNRALRVMDQHSRYCKFIQADDWMFPECLERMVDVAERHPSVGLVTAYALNGNRVQLDGLFEYWQDVMPGREALRRLICGRWQDWIVGGPSSVLLRADLVRSEAEFYDHTIWHADTDGAFRILLQSDLGFVHQVMTFMRGDNPRGMTSFSWRVYTFLPMEGRALIRFGPAVLSAADYRRAMRTWLKRYARFLFRQSLSPARHHQPEFHHFHRHEIDCMIAEATRDPETRLILSSIRLLLHRERRRSEDTVA
jgi:glycosyltransferase involved in cell wall biosynthesis